MHGNTNVKFTEVVFLLCLLSCIAYSCVKCGIKYDTFYWCLVDSYNMRLSLPQLLEGSKGVNLMILLRFVSQTIGLHFFTMMTGDCVSSCDAILWLDV